MCDHPAVDIDPLWFTDGALEDKIAGIAETVVLVFFFTWTDTEIADFKIGIIDSEFGIFFMREYHLDDMFWWDCKPGRLGMRKDFRFYQ